jgi:AcrR family transcriptional regulator
MTRVVKEYNERRNEIIQMAQRLIYTKGFESMTIQDILDGLQISKGAFYHYFDSKQGLLEAIIDQMNGEAIKIFVPIVDDPGFTALEKFHLIFDTVARWKTAQKEYILQLLSGWYKDENAVVRHKVTVAGIELISPHFSRIIQQGIKEGVFSCPCQENVGEVIMALMQSVGETVARLMLANSPGSPVNMNRIMGTVAAYTDAMERVLGSKPGALHLFDIEMLKIWISPLEENSN